MRRHYEADGAQPNKRRDSDDSMATTDDSDNFTDRSFRLTERSRRTHNDPLPLHKPVFVTKQRKCTDIPCTIFFGLAMFSACCISLYSWAAGNLDHLYYGRDSWGNLCGHTNEPVGSVPKSGMNMKSKPFLFYYSIAFSIAQYNGFDLYSVKLCVEACPPRAITTDTELQNLATYGNIHLCLYGYPVKQYKLVEDGGIAKAIGANMFFPDAFASTVGYNMSTQQPYLGPCPPKSAVDVGYISILHRCVPQKDTSDEVDKLGTYVMSEVFQRVAHDFRISWPYFLVLCIVAFTIALMTLVFLRYFAAIFVYTLCFIICAGAVTLSALLWWKYDDKKKRLKQYQEAEVVDGVKIATHSLEKNVTIWLLAAIIVTAITVIVILVLIALRKRISLVVYLIKEAGKAIMTMPMLLLQPAYTFLSIGITMATAILTFLFLHSSTYPAVQPVFYSMHVVEEYPIHIIYIRWIYFFLVVWIVEFIIACQHMVIAGAVGSWYFTVDKKDVKSPIITAIRNLIEYHLGTVAFGSFIITLVTVIRYLVMKFHGKLIRSQHPVAKFCLTCCVCIIWLVEKVLRYLSMNAYIATAIYGCNFWTAAQKAFTVVVNNVLRVATINSIGDFLLFLGKLSIGIVSFIAALKLIELWDLNLNFPWLPALLAGLFGLLIGQIFISVYEMAIDTIFLSFCEDCNENDGMTRPYYMSKSLMKFVENTKQAMAARKELEDRKDKESKQRREEKC